ncbi:DUF2779 domain-containing protein [Spiroplasma tabanidicola]|uniref:DUF2779 domain-containing protein n=1 Tax=Spiroplasma tabanidicola TaxID=324079 RepID=A0A6I6C6J5_9MOLU|nr:DUF2779 domain-containing protein [Spiroplasma tabanidicola]QGS51790.1 hypothetical protein STABA_v1c04270 [Spiroplasma tabanidicola]
MELKNVVKKKDFIKWFASCNKEAWVFHNLKNFEKAIHLRDKKVYEFFLTEELEEGGFESGSGFDPLELYKNILNNKDLSEEQKKQKELLLNILDEFDGLELSTINNNFILDGNDTGQAAREYFIEMLTKENIKNNTNFKYYDFQQSGYQDSKWKTIELINNPEYKLFFEPTFEKYDGKMKTRCDILFKNEDGSFDIIEVKASTKEKDSHFFDLFYQWYIVSESIIIKNIKLCLLNKEYFRGVNGKLYMTEDLNDTSNLVDYKLEVEEILKRKIVIQEEEPDYLNYDKLFILNNSIEKRKIRIDYIDFFKSIRDNFEIDNEILKMSNTFINDKILSDKMCGCYELDFKNLNLKIKEKVCSHVVKWFNKKKFSIFDLPKNKEKSARFYYDKNKVYIEDLDWGDINSFFYKNGEKEYFNEDCKKIIKITQNYIKKNNNINIMDMVDINKKEVLKEVVRDYFNYPIYMFDFETSMWAIPKYNKSKSYQQIPFQFSVHIITNENYDFKNPDKTMIHYNFIAKSPNDPRPEFLSNFLKACFLKGPGKYVAYNKSFERMVIKDLILMFPEFIKPLKYIYENTIDLMNFFQLPKNNWLIYHPEFRGSASIKVTQPVLDSSLTYKDLKINKGDKASSVFRRFADNYFSQDLWDKLYKPDMLLYCDRDTLAMVVILQVVINYIKETSPDILKEIKGEI